MWLWMKWHCKLVHGWIVYTELALRWQQFHVAPAMQQPKSTISTPLLWILIIRAIKGYSHSFRITCDMCTLSLLESREQHYIKKAMDIRLTCVMYRLGTGPRQLLFRLCITTFMSSAFLLAKVFLLCKHVHVCISGLDILVLGMNCENLQLPAAVLSLLPQSLTADVCSPLEWCSQCFTVCILWQCDGNHK